MAKNSFDGYIDQIGKYFANLPALPKGGRDFIVMVLPWIALIFGALGVLDSISSLGLFTYFSPYLYLSGVNGAGLGMISIILGFVASLLLLIAFPGLKNKKEKGWKFTYYSEVVALVSNIVVFSVPGVVISLLGFYLLYQVRTYYK